MKSRKCLIKLISISLVLIWGECFCLINITQNENYFKQELRSSSYERAIVVFENNNKYRSKNKELQLYARSATLMDAMNGRILYEKYGNMKLPMASTTKIMTCILALEEGCLEDKVVASKLASHQPKVRMNVKEGEEYYLSDLLYALMLESYNDVAVMIAEHLGGSVENFAKMMNNKAKEIGCCKTNFVTPNGLDDDNHYTTAVELAKIAQYAIGNVDFLEIINSKQYSFQNCQKNRQITVTNKDGFLNMYSGAFGIKTGFTSKAGYCFVGAAQRNDKTLISVVLGAGWPPNKTLKWKDTSKILDYGFQNFKQIQLVPEIKWNIPIYTNSGYFCKAKFLDDIEGYCGLGNGNEEAKVIALLSEFNDNNRYVKHLYFIDKQCCYENENRFIIKTTKEEYIDSLKKIIKLY